MKQLAVAALLALTLAACGHDRHETKVKTKTTTTTTTTTVEPGPAAEIK